MHSVKRFALTVLITLSLIMCTFPVMADERLNNEAAKTAKYLRKHLNRQFHQQAEIGQLSELNVRRLTLQIVIIQTI